MHGIYHDDVEDIITREVAFKSIPFTVITGKSNRMKELVREAAESMGLQVREVIHNPGRLVIYDK